jgi:homoserine O-succinyltransferase
VSILRSANQAIPNVKGPKMNNLEKEFRIAILDMYDGFENEGMRCIKKIITEFGIKEQLPVSFTVFDVRQKLEVPELEYDAYISTGGPGNPAPAGHDWEIKFFSFLDKLLAYNSSEEEIRKKHLFLICHSFQMASLHWDLANVSKRRKTSFGTFPVHKTPLGKTDQILHKLYDPFWIVDSRDYQVTQPNKANMEAFGAIVLCLEKKRPHIPLEQAIMSIKFSGEIFGTQFHPEADAEGMLRYFLRDDKKASIVSNHGEAKYNNMIDHLNDPDKILMTESVIIPTFLKNALQKSYSSDSVTV